MEVARNLLALLGGGAAIALAIAGATYWLFRTFSEKWLTAKFEQRLAAYKHEQQKELEQLRFKISGLLDRTIKLYQREFEILPEVWSKLSDAYVSTRAIVAGLQRYPDLNRMGNAQLAEFLSRSELPTWKQDEIKTAHDKTASFTTELSWKRKNAAQSEYYNFNDYLRKNGMFIRADLKTKFTALSDLIHMAITEHELNLENPHHPNSRVHVLKLVQEGEIIRSELEVLIQARLWDSQMEEVASAAAREASALQ